MVIDTTSKETLWTAASSEQVVSTDLGSGTALLDLRSGQYFTLDSVGSLVWSLLQTPSPKSRLIGAVVEQYEVTADQCAGDIDLLLEELQSAALVEAIAAPAQ